MEVGRRFGKLVFIGKSEKKYGRSRGWIVRCDCGTVKTVCHSNVSSGSVTSCGCARRNVYAKTPEFRAIKSAISRCHNKNDKDYDFYGARGISVCSEWRENPVLFVHHIGKRPTPRHSLDRMDNNKDYIPGNVRWATKLDQSRNRRSVNTINVDGKEIPIIEHCQNIGVKYETFRTRYFKKKWPMRYALDPRHGHTISAEMKENR